MNSRLFKTFFSSGIQVIAIQFLGGIFFYITSLYLSKSEFGLISWSNGVCMTITMILGFGMEQVVVRKIASSHQSGNWVASVYFLHNVFISFLAIVIIFVLSYFFNTQTHQYLLFFIFVSQAFIFISLPLKQLLNAKENFTPYAKITFGSNMLKVIFIVVCVICQAITVNLILLILLFTSLLEFLFTWTYVKKHEDFKLFFRIRAYFALIKISYHQYISVIFDAILTRSDWILLGIFCSKSVVADYSFSYRMYELSRLPIFALAPILLLKFTHIAERKSVMADKSKQLQYLFTIEMFVAILVPLCLNIVWGPWIDVITKNKYGRVNSYCFFILSTCVTLHFMINYMWTAFVATKNFKKISFVVAISAILNLVLNLILIPRYDKIGAAYAYLAAILIQVIIFYYYIRKTDFKISLSPFFVFLIIALVAYFGSGYLTTITEIRLAVSIAIYVTLSIVSKQIGVRHFKWIKQSFR